MGKINKNQNNTTRTKKKPNCTHTADLDEDQSLIESQVNSRNDLDIPNSHINNVRTSTVPTTTTTTTQAATATNAKNCRGLIQKRAHTLDDFMEGKRNLPRNSILHQKKNKEKKNPSNKL